MLVLRPLFPHSSSGTELLVLDGHNLVQSVCHPLPGPNHHPRQRHASFVAAAVTARGRSWARARANPASAANTLNLSSLSLVGTDGSAIDSHNIVDSCDLLWSHHIRRLAVWWWWCVVCGCLLFLVRSVTDRSSSSSGSCLAIVCMRQGRSTLATVICCPRLRPRPGHRP